MKSRKKNKLTKRQSGRVASANARADRFHSESFNALHGLRKLITPAYYEDFSNVQDYRRFHFDPYAHPLTTIGTRARADFVPAVVNRGSRRRISGSNLRLSSRVVFNRPDSVIECVRRQRRKEVIHAKGRAGTRVAKPRYTDLSNLHCK